MSSTGWTRFCGTWLPGRLVEGDAPQYALKPDARSEFRCGCVGRVRRAVDRLGLGSSSVSTQSARSRKCVLSGPALPKGLRLWAASRCEASIARCSLFEIRPGRPTVNCQASSSAERRVAPFGRTRLPLFTCELTLTGERASYVVQVLHDGCFVAERRRPGRAVYGCGADRS